MPKTMIKYGSSKEKLIWAAKQLFARKGYKATTVREIANLADIRESQINHHFGSKESLLSACLEGLEDVRLKDIQNHLTHCASSVELRSSLESLILDLIEAHLKLYDQVRILYLIELTDGKYPSSFQKKWLQLFSEIVSFLEREKEQGIVRKQANTQFFVELIYNSVSYSMLFNEYMKSRSGVDLFKERDRKEFVNRHLDLLLPSITHDSSLTL